MGTFTQLEQKFASIWPLLDERTRRLMAASEARALGHGGVSQVSRACGLSRKAIAKGLLVHPPDVLLAKVREYAASPAVKSTPIEFIPHPATWFNAGRYDDDPAEWQVRRHTNEQPQQPKAIPMKIGRWE